MPDRTEALLDEWWSQLDGDKKTNAQAEYYRVKADRMTRNAILHGVLAPTLTESERRAITTDGALPKDIQTYIMRHD